MHRRDRACHWCGERPVAAWRSKAVLKSATGIAAVALLAVGSWSVRDQAQLVISRVFAADPVGRTAAIRAPEIRSASTLAALPESAIPSAQPATSDTMMLAMADAASAGPSVDSVRWVPAVARTWVNVRRDASRGGDVVGVIKPSEKAMLGIGRQGWRQVKSPDVSGWVDPKLFEADSLNTRG
jgi:hypothetical protein